MLVVFRRNRFTPLAFTTLIVPTCANRDNARLFPFLISRVSSMSVSDDNYWLKPLEERHAWDILDWEYPSPYDFYNSSFSEHQEHYVKQFMNPELRFHAVLDTYGTMIGFCSFGPDGQVPGGVYSDEALDIGIGMRPELTGQGKGAAFFGAILGYALGSLNPELLRLTVAKFNHRALKLYKNFGFEDRGEFFAQPSAVSYQILVRAATRHG